MLPPELTALALAPRHLVELRALLRRHVPDAEVWAFGSRVSGGAHEGSDLDLVLRSVQEPAQPVAGTAALQEALQHSNLPMMVEVHDWALVPVAFHESIRRAHVILQVPQNLALAEAAHDKLGGTPPGDPALAKEGVPLQEGAAGDHLRGTK